MGGREGKGRLKEDSYSEGKQAVDVGGFLEPGRSLSHRHGHVLDVPVLFVQREWGSYMTQAVWDGMISGQGGAEQSRAQKQKKTMIVAGESRVESRRRGVNNSSEVWSRGWLRRDDTEERDDFISSG